VVGWAVQVERYECQPWDEGACWSIGKELETCLVVVMWCLLCLFVCFRKLIAL
jgi:hypothetical protein